MILLAGSKDGFTLARTISGDFDGLTPMVRRSLYCVCQEALANTARHAGVDTARIYPYVEPDEVYLSIRDRGRGFDPNPQVRLTPREKEVLRWMATPGTYREIAEQLYVSEETIRSQAKRMLSKPRQPNRTQAALAAVRAGQVELPN